MYTCTQSFESVACPLELVILSRKFRIPEYEQSSVFECSSFFQQNSLEVFQELHFHQLMGIHIFFLIRNSFIRNLYWDSQIAKKLSVLKPQRLRNLCFSYHFLIIILKI